MEMRERIGVKIEKKRITSVEMNKETAAWVLAFSEGFKESVRRCSKRFPKNFEKLLGESIANKYTNCSCEIRDYEQFLHAVDESVKILTGQHII